MSAWLYKRPGSRRFWMGWRANGKQFLASTGTDDEKKANEKLAELEFLERAKNDGKLTERFIESLTAKPLSTVTLKSAMDDWLLECQGATAKSTYDRYAVVVREFCAFIGATDCKPLLRDVTTEEIRQFLTRKRAATTAANANINRRILTGFFLRAVRNGLIRDNPMLPIRMFKASADERQSRRAFTLDEMNLIYAKAPSDFWRYMIVGGFFTGLRLSDLATMRWGAVDFVANGIHITVRKTSKPLHIPIAKPFRTMLETLKLKAATVRPTDPIWPAEARKCEQQGSKVLSNAFFEEILTPAGLVTARPNKKKQKLGRGVKRENSAISFHCLRHTFISYLKLTGGTQAVSKALAGHTSDLVNDLYSHLPMEALANAVNQLPEIK